MSAHKVGPEVAWVARSRDQNSAQGGAAGVDVGHTRGFPKALFGSSRKLTWKV